jgi:GT2 family glycosyltransferase
MSAPPSVTVIIVAYQAGEFLQRCINALAAQSFADFEAVIADNASSDGSVANLRLPDSRFVVQSMGGNLGFAVANNRVALASKAEFLALLNPDTEAEPDWLAELVAAARGHPHAASIGSLQLRLDDPQVLDGLGDVWHAAGVAWRSGEGRPRSFDPGDGEIFGPCAAAALYRREAFVAVGAFEERFFCYSEDVDLAVRLRLAGYGSWRASSAVVRHAGSGITGRVSEFSLFHGHRNRIWTFLKTTPGLWFWLLLPYHLAFNTGYLIRAWQRGVLPVILSAYRAAWAGRAPFLDARRKLRPKVSFRRVLAVMCWDPVSPWVRAVHPRPAKRAP